MGTIIYTTKSAICTPTRASNIFFFRNYPSHGNLIILKKSTMKSYFCCTHGVKKNNAIKIQFYRTLYNNKNRDARSWWGKGLRGSMMSCTGRSGAIWVGVGAMLCRNLVTEQNRNFTKVGSLKNKYGSGNSCSLFYWAFTVDPLFLTTQAH